MEQMIRRVAGYNRNRNRTKVKSYYQKYDKPRGPVTKLQTDSATASSRTIWLMNRSGKFIGRANSQGQTTADKKQIAKLGMDRTKAIRDAKKYKRVFGRVPQSRT